MTEALPSRLGVYEVEGVLGHGAASVVLRARARDGRPVAIKLLRQGAAADAAARFRHEQELQAELGSEAGFVPLLDAGEGPGGPWLVMPLAPGGTLRDRLRRGELSAEEARALVAALSQALGRAHALGVVHRDLKPENILFDAGGSPLVADLGLAKWEDGTGALSRTGEFRGTAGYMAPEQLQDAKHVGPQADVFALGAILHECLAGAPAFPGGSALEVLDRVLAGRPAPPPARTPRWLRRVVARCLAAEPSDRYPDGASLHAVLTAGPTRPGGLATAVTAALALGLLVGVALSRASTSSAPLPVTSGAPEAAKTGAPAQSTPGPAESVSDLAAARERLRAGDAAGALEALERHLGLAPGDLEALGLRGRAHLELGRPREAAVDLDLVLSRAPDRPDVRLARALARARLGDLPGALVDLDRVVALAPTAEALTLRGEVRALRGDDRGALADYDAAIGLAPTATAFRWRGEVRARLGDVPGALADLDRAVELAPDEVSNMAVRGAIRHNSGDPLGAVRDYDRGLTLATGAPRRAELHRERGRSRYAAGDLEEALADLERALTLSPGEPAAEALRSEVRAALGPADPAGVWTTPVAVGVQTLTVQREADGRYALRWEEPGAAWNGCGLVRAGRLLCSWGRGETSVLVISRDGEWWRGEWCAGLASPALPHRRLAWSGADLAGGHSVAGGELRVERTAHALRVTWRDGDQARTGVGLELPSGAVVAFGAGEFGCMEFQVEDELVGRWIDQAGSEAGKAAAVQRFRPRR